MKFFYSSFLLIVLMSCSQKDQKTSESIADQYYNKAENFYAVQKYDSAFLYFNKAYQAYTLENKTKDATNALVYQSIIQTIKSDYYGSEESASDALKKLDKNDKVNRDLLVSIYNQIALNKELQKDYISAINWYKLAIEKITSPYDSLVLQNNLAVSYYEGKKYGDAIKILNTLKAKNVDSTVIKARIIDNLAYAKYLQNSSYNAEPELHFALALREKENDVFGKNASYTHLSNYFYEKDKSKALFYTEKMLETSYELNSPDDRLEALQRLVLLETPEQSKSYFKQYQKLNDSLQASKSKARNQFALIRYETEKQKAETIKKQNQILKQYIVLSALIVGIVLIFIWFERRKKRLKQEKEIEVKKTQLKYSKKVHDVVANGLYHTMVEIQNNPELGKETILNNIEKMYEESRDIARDDFNEILEKEYSVRLNEMLSSYSSDYQKVLIVGSNPKNWENVSAKIQTELFYVLRELMVNMKKHSQAKLVLIKIENNENQLSIHYTDNGVGIENLEIISTSGIQNMENRIVAIGGTTNFEKNPKGGLIIHITVPIQ